jgi:hypothetical protein
LRKLIRGYANFINEKLVKYFSILLGKAFTIEKLKELRTLKDFTTISKIRKVLNHLIEMDNSKYGVMLSTYEKKIKKLDTQIIANNKKQKLQLQIGNADAVISEGLGLVNSKIMLGLINDDDIERYKNFKFSSGSNSSEDITPEELLQGKLSGKLSGKAKDCPDGKVINPKTGRCINIKKVVEKEKEKEVKVQRVEVKDCPPGKVLNPVTNRCVKIQGVKGPVLVKDCPEGKVINPKTGRCIKIDNKAETQKQKRVLKLLKKMRTVRRQSQIKELKKQQKDELVKVCPPGKVLNPKTNRCVNIKLNKTKKNK